MLKQVSRKRDFQEFKHDRKRSDPRIFTVDLKRKEVSMLKETVEYAGVFLISVPQFDLFILNEALSFFLMMAME